MSNVRPESYALLGAARPGADTRSAADLKQLFEAHYAHVWRLMRRFGVPVAEVDDAVQEVFRVVARRLSDVREGSERAFLYGIALRTAGSQLRRRRALPPVTALETLPELRDLEPSPEEQLEQHQARVLLDAVLDQLPLELRLVFVLAELEGLPVKEIAELQAIPVGTASSRLRRAREEFSAIARRVRIRLAREGATFR